jgi:hypothetical protein
MLSTVRMKMIEAARREVFEVLMTQELDALFGCGDLADARDVYAAEFARELEQIARVDGE